MTTENLTLRVVEPRNIPQTVETIAPWLASNSADELLHTYPQVFGPNGKARSFGVFIGTELVSHAATRSVRLVTPDGVVRIILIGSVATAPEYRGRGLASDLVRQITETAESEGNHAAMLWAQNWKLYERLGFAPYGDQFEAVIEREFDGPPTHGVRTAGPGDLFGILQLHNRKPCAVDRDLVDLAVLLSPSPMQTVVLERGDRIVSYACYGKGIDFDGWWHEFGGEDADVAALIRGAMRQTSIRQATVMIPSYRTRLMAMLDDAILQVNRGVVALCKKLAPIPGAELFVDGLDSI